MRGIDQVLRQAEFRDKFDIKQHWAVRVVDLQGYLLRYKPDIVHFSGHGSASTEIILEDNYGNSQSVSSRALSQLFAVLKDNIRCVVLNACYSEQQAKAIAEHIDCVIGMSKAIGDKAAISFAVAFYQALGFGRDVKTAFDLGCVQIDLENLNDQDTPKLLASRNKPEEIVFVRELEKKVASKEGPLGNRKFSDHKINAVLTSLRKVHHDLNSETLPMDHLLLELDILFDRKTFRHESIRMCISQLWSERLHTAYQTFEMLQAYQRNVREKGRPAQYSLYRQLLAEVNGYCMNMGVYLFEQPVDETEIRDFIGTSEFKVRLPKERKFEIGIDGLKLADEIVHYCDGKRESAIKLMYQLIATVK